MALLCKSLLVLVLLFVSSNCWPGMKHNSNTQEYNVNLHHKSINKFTSHNQIWNLNDNETVIGPHCTVGAHNNFTQFGPCPDMIQPTSEPDYHAKKHIFASQFVMNWIMYFVRDPNDVPPYDTVPNTPYTFTYGTTYYDTTYFGGAMKESYYQRCIPVFGGSMGYTNNYSCDFITINSNETAYVVLHSDKPKYAPDCCIIGKPFHAPPQDFAKGLTVKFESTVNNTLVDWSAIWLSDSGVFSYGFEFNSPNEYGIPYGFYMQVEPWIAYWAYQKFYNFTITKPNESEWIIPDTCYNAEPCPGWDPN